MKKLLAIVLAALMPLTSFATECGKPVTLLPEGTPAPCRGFLFTPDKELEVRLLSKEKELLESEVDTKNKLIDRLKKDNELSGQVLQLEAQKSELWRIRAEDSTKKLIESESGRQNRDLMWLIGGVLLTVAAGYAVGQAGK